MFIWLSFFGFGIKFPTKDASRTSIIVGYIFAVLGGIMGLLFGIGLALKDNPEDKFHGRAIFTIGVLAIILYLLPLSLQMAIHWNARIIIARFHKPENNEAQNVLKEKHVNLCW